MISNHKNLRNRLKETRSSACAIGGTLGCREEKIMHPSSTTFLRRVVHTHMYTICLHTGCFLGQFCGGQASFRGTGWEGQAHPDGLHLCLITTHQAGWTQPLTLKHEFGMGLPQDKHTTWSLSGLFFKADCSGNSQMTGSFSL